MKAPLKAPLGVPLRASAAAPPQASAGAFPEAACPGPVRGRGQPARSFLRRLAGVLAWLVLCAAAFAPAAAQAPEGEAQQVLQRAAQALGLNPGQLRTVRASGVVLALGDESQAERFSLAAERDGRVRWQTGPEPASATVLDGYLGFVRTSEGESLPLSLAASSGRGLEAALPLALAAWMRSPRHRAGAVDAASGEPAARRVEVGRTAPGRSERVRGAVERASLSRLVVEEAGGLPLRLESNLHPSDHRIDLAVEYRYSDWREAGGLLWPFTVRLVTASGRVVSEYRYRQVEINPALGEEDFR